MPSNKQVTLRPYQENAISSWQTWRKRGFNSLLLHLATGTGKTHLALELIMRHFPLEQHRTLWIAHTVELLEQPYKSLFRANPSLRGQRYGPFGYKPAGIVQASNKDHSARVVFASIQTLRNIERLKAYVKHGLPSLIVIDEAHHTVAESYATALLKTLILYAFELEDKTSYDEALLERCYEDAQDEDRTVATLCKELELPFSILGLTATPMRTDRKGLNNVFQRIAYSYPLVTAIQQGYLLPIEAVQVLTHIDVSGVGVNSTTGEFNQTQLASLLEAKNWMQLVWDAMKKHMPTLRHSALIAMPSVEMALEWAQYASKHRYPTACVSSKFVYHPKEGMEKNGTKKYWELRAKIFNDLRNGKILGLSGYNTFIEGVDLPRVTYLVWGRPTKSEPLFTQAVGRVTRTPDGVSRILVDGKTNEYVVVMDNGDIERYKPDEVPFETTCRVIDVTATGTTLLTVGTLFGDSVRKPAKTTEEDDAEFERLTEEINTLRRTDNKRVQLGNGTYSSRRSLFRKTHLPFLYDERTGWQSVALGKNTTLMIMPPNDMLSAVLYDAIDHAEGDVTERLAELSNIYDSYSLWFVTAPLSGDWPRWASKNARAYLCGLYEVEGEAINESYTYIGMLGAASDILTRRDASWRRHPITFKQIKLFSALSAMQWSNFIKEHRIGAEQAVRSFLELHPKELQQLMKIDEQARVKSRKDLFVLQRRSGIVLPTIDQVIRYTKGYAVDYYRHLVAEAHVRIALDGLRNGEVLQTFDDYQQKAIMEAV